MVDIQFATAEIRRGKKNKRQDENIYGLPYYKYFTQPQPLQCIA